MITNHHHVNLFDAHAHLPLHPSTTNLCLAGCVPEEWGRIAELSDRVFRVGFGHHPWFAAQPKHIDRLHQFLEQHPLSFVGEIGLDRSPKYKATFLKQQALFAEQLCIARDLRRPVVIHLVRSSAVGYELIHQHYGPKVYLHGYICSLEESKRYPHAFFGFNHKMFKSPKTHALLSSLPIEQIVLETDGESNPKDLWNTACQIANIRGTSVDTIIKLTRENTLRWLNHE